MLIVGSLTRAPNYLEGVLSTHVEVDGSDATSWIGDMIMDSRFHEQAKVIFTDGGAVGGFNVIDLEDLHELTGIPVISVSRDEPDFQGIERALKKHFTDWRSRLELFRTGDVHTVETGHLPIYIKMEGVELNEARRLLKLFTVRGRLPEPVRISHLVASGIVRGESRGKA